jgi:hypothetical protein
MAIQFNDDSNNCMTGCFDLKRSRGLTHWFCLIDDWHPNKKNPTGGLGSHIFEQRLCIESSFIKYAKYT